MLTLHDTKAGRSRWLLTMTACVLLIAAACKPAPQAAATPPPPKVSVAAVIQDSTPIVLELSGTLEAVKSIDIIPRVTGYLDQRFFVEGSLVKQGDPLYLIDPRPFQASLDAARAQLAIDQANLDFYESEVARFTRLASDGAASQERLDSVTAQQAEAKGAVARDKANVTSAELDLAYTSINAPFAGRIQRTNFDAGELVSAQKDTLTQLIQIDPIYAVFNISRRQLFDVQLMQREGLAPADLEQLMVGIELPDGSEYAHEGKVDYVSAQIDPATDTVTMRAVIPNPADEAHKVDLIAGQYVPVLLHVGTRPDTLLIPRKALVQGQQGSQVYVVGANNKVESRVVELGTIHGDSIEVSKGLHKGERVIVDGVQKVRPGAVVDATPVTPATKPN